MAAIRQENHWRATWVNYALPYLFPKKKDYGLEYELLIHPPRMEFIGCGVIDVLASYAEMVKHRKPEEVKKDHDFLRFYVSVRQLERFYSGQSSVPPFLQRTPLPKYIRYATEIRQADDATAGARSGAIITIQAGLYMQPPFGVLYFPDYHRYIRSIIQKIKRVDRNENILDSFQTHIYESERNAVNVFDGSADYKLYLRTGLADTAENDLRTLKMVYHMTTESSNLFLSYMKSARRANENHNLRIEYTQHENAPQPARRLSEEERDEELLLSLSSSRLHSECAQYDRAVQARCAEIAGAFIEKNLGAGIFMSNPIEEYIDPAAPILHVIQQVRVSERTVSPPRIVLWVSSHGGLYYEDETTPLFDVDPYIENILQLAWAHVGTIRSSGSRTASIQYPGHKKVLRSLVTTGIFGGIAQNGSEHVHFVEEESAPRSTRENERNSAAEALTAACSRFMSHDQFLDYCNVALINATGLDSEADNGVFYKNTRDRFFSGGDANTVGATFKTHGAFHNMIVVIDDLPKFWGNRAIQTFELCMQYTADQMVQHRSYEGALSPIMMFICRGDEELYHDHRRYNWMSTLQECLVFLSKYYDNNTRGRGRGGGAGESRLSEFEIEKTMRLDYFVAKPPTGPRKAIELIEQFRLAHLVASSKFLYAGPDSAWRPLGSSSPSSFRGLPLMRTTVENYTAVTYVGAQQLLVGPRPATSAWHDFAKDLEMTIARRFETIRLNDCGFVHLPSWKFENGDCSKPVGR